MYAIIQTGGKQYRVQPGDVVSLEKLEGDVGSQVVFDKILLVAKDSGPLIGKPLVSGAKLEAEIVDQTKGEKLLTIKYRRRKGYRKVQGHRQLLTRVLVTKLDDGQGGSESFDASKRADVLRKASVKFSTRQSEHEAKHKKTDKTGSEKTVKAASASAGKSTKIASRTKTAAKSRTTKKAKE
ncbi:MAG: 50S ribosomal protein L21 [Bacteriovoracia bacterium]